MDAGKREREDEDPEADANERAAKALLLTDQAQEMQRRYEREQWNAGSGSLITFPREIRQMIVTMNAGTLMSMARAHRLWRDLARNENVWRAMYERDFRHDWAFCGGELPFFVLEPTHPLWDARMVAPEDATAWKRFYLQTASRYHRANKELPRKTLHAIHAWRHNQWRRGDTRPKRERVAELCWLFVCVVMDQISEEILTSPIQEVALGFWRFARSDPSRQWLIPYLTHSDPDGIDDEWMYWYQTGGSIAGQEHGYISNFGPNTWHIYNSWPRTGEALKPYYDYLVAHRPWQDRLDLFDDGLMNRLRDIVVQREHREMIALLKACYLQPCVLNIEIAPIWSKMIVHPLDVRREVMEQDAGASVRNITPGLRLRCSPFAAIHNVRIDATDVMSTYMFFLFDQFASLPRNWAGVIRFIACRVCGSQEALQQCGGQCNDQGAIYCGRACQTHDWYTGGHRHKCGTKK